jgi:drug/metabolite transporter (DMT)-like permease
VRNGGEAEARLDNALLRPAVLIPFVLVTLIWGSTWFVILGQLGPVPAPWSVTYRFAIAAAAMFAYCAATRRSVRIGREGHALAALYGIPQFCLNYNAVYAAEQYVTSGLVAVTFALLMVPNSAMVWLFLGQRPTGRFIAGSALAAAGIALLFVQEMRASGAATGQVLAGVGFTLIGILAASVSNTMQASQRLKRRPVASMIAWAMVYGVIANAAFAWLVSGRPVFDGRPEYWLGLFYLGLLGSAFAFALYFGVIRAVGPGKAAYSSLLVPIVAMLISTLFEHYRWSPLAISGGLLALAGLVVALRAKSAPAEAAP